MRIPATIIALLALLAVCTALAQDWAAPPTRVCPTGLYGCLTHADVLATWPARCPMCQTMLTAIQSSDTASLDASPIAVSRGGRAAAVPGRDGRMGPLIGRGGGTVPLPGLRGGSVPMPGRAGGMGPMAGREGGRGMRSNEEFRERGLNEELRERLRRNEELRERFRRFGYGSQPFGYPFPYLNNGYFGNPYGGNYSLPYGGYYNPYAGNYFNPYWGYYNPYYYYWNPWYYYPYHQGW